MNQSQTIQRDYVFDEKRVLPTGALRFTVLKGDAWVFTECCNFIVHEGEQRTLAAKSTPPTIHRAYTRGFAKYQVERIER